jgi:hypothetical protein
MCVLEMLKMKGQRIQRKVIIIRSYPESDTKIVKRELVPAARLLDLALRNAIDGRHTQRFRSLQEP